jgi:hypothetical protein
MRPSGLSTPSFALAAPERKGRDADLRPERSSGINCREGSPAWCVWAGLYLRQDAIRALVPLRRDAGRA